MTRINFGILAKDLTDQHLLAEFRELPRIPRKVKRCILEDKPINVNDGDFCLGSGHVRWFYDKLGYLRYRYNDLAAECKKRFFNVTEDEFLFYILEDEIADSILTNNYMGDEVEDVNPKHISLVKTRIATRIRESKQTPRYYGKEIDKELYINTILKLKS
jgi:deoxyribonuclease (pyrimidine dimer)